MTVTARTIARKDLFGHTLADLEAKYHITVDDAALEKENSEPNVQACPITLPESATAPPSTGLKFFGKGFAVPPLDMRPPVAAPATEVALKEVAAPKPKRQRKQPAKQQPVRKKSVRKKPVREGESAGEDSPTDAGGGAAKKTAAAPRRWLCVPSRPKRGPSVGNNSSDGELSASDDELSSSDGDSEVDAMDTDEVIPAPRVRGPPAARKKDKKEQAAAPTKAAPTKVAPKPRRSGLGTARGAAAVVSGKVSRDGGVLLRKRAEELCDKAGFYPGEGLDFDSVVEIDDTVTLESGSVFLLVHQVKTSQMGWVNNLYITRI